jgi:hypothetical protein
MAYDKFLIAPFEEGLRTDLKPWQIPADSFERLNNCYVFRGRIKKRFGSHYTGTGWSSESIASLYSRLRILIGTTNAGTGNLNVSPVPGAIFKAGQMFSIDNYVYTSVPGTVNLRPSCWSSNL